MSEDPRIGTVIAGCRIERRLRPGGMSVVYLAEHLHLERKVAVKLLARQLVQDEDYRKRFLRESRLAAAMYHPNIVPIYDAGEAEGIPYITMHFVQGSDLAETIEREGPLAPERALEIMRQVVNALDAAHERGLVHRDVKPANILIASGSGAEPSGHVYLTDFGLAKQVASGSRLTRPGLFMGTLDYVAPEQIQGGDVDRRADVYSLGCVIFQCLTGEAPYGHDSEVAMMYAHLQQPPPRASERRPGLPPAVDDVLARAMAKSPEDRHATCGELLAALGAALEAREAEERVPEPAPQETVVAPVPEPKPAAPPLDGVAALDYQGERYALGRTRDAYAIWNCHEGGGPVRTFPLDQVAWPGAWQTWQELETAPPVEAERLEAPAPAETATTPAGTPVQPLLAGVLFLDYRGTRHGLGRTQDGYAIWDLGAGGAPIEAFALTPQDWERAWGRYQALESGSGEKVSAQPASGPAPTPAPEPVPAVPELVDAVAIDYQGTGYALGRSPSGYAIWDLRAGGRPILTFAANPQAWQQAWGVFQQLEQRRGAG